MIWIVERKGRKDFQKLVDKENLGKYSEISELIHAWIVKFVETRESKCYISWKGIRIYACERINQRAWVQRLNYTQVQPPPFHVISLVKEQRRFRYKHTWFLCNNCWAPVGQLMGIFLYPVQRDALFPLLHAEHVIVLCPQVMVFLDWKEGGEVE